jgi:Lrp/AsnC family transcriptional regulator for asnA, asnC and gidA
MTPPDDLDRRIIALLEKDATLAPEAIAKTIRASVSTVRRRIRALVEGKVIRMTITVDPDKMGASVGAIIALDVVLNKLDELIQFVLTREEVTWVTVTTGRYDVLISARFKTNQHLLDFLMNVLGPLEGIRSSETFFLLKPKRRRVWESLS